ncbi:MAG TPA: hypothetical protein DCQ64_30800 [Candidatus Rokubacteria bacterium]|nr:hypothetical protein [Candidatus Rokubacteria bacterium]
MALAGPPAWQSAQALAPAGPFFAQSASAASARPTAGLLVGSRLSPKPGGLGLVLGSRSRSFSGGAGPFSVLRKATRWTISSGASTPPVPQGGMVVLGKTWRGS